MAKRRASFTETDVKRAIRAAKSEGFDRVELIPSPDGLRVVCERTSRSSDKAERVEELE